VEVERQQLVMEVVKKQVQLGAGKQGRREVGEMRQALLVLQGVGKQGYPGVGEKQGYQEVGVMR